MNTPDAQRPRSELFRRIALVLVSLVVGLGLLELGLRASTWSWLFAWPNFVLDARKVLADRDSGRTVHDERLGYVPRAGYATAGITIEENGVRRTGPAPADGRAPILAVGDSFTFGEEVGDGETWPADLQRLTGRRVLNGGVSGYGFDQIVLRTEALAPLYRPEAIVVAFIADDIRRTEMRRLWSADKPYFDARGRRAPPARRARPAARAGRRDAHLLAEDAGLFLRLRLHPAAPRPAARLVRRSCPRPSARHRRAPVLSADGAARRTAEERRREDPAGRRVRSRRVGRSELRGRAAPHDGGTCWPAARRTAWRRSTATRRSPPRRDRATSMCCGT